MVVGSSCSDMGALERACEVGEDVWGVERPMREYFVLEGRVSAESSCRKLLSSLSAISSLERGFEDAASEAGCGSGGGPLSFWSGGNIGEGVVEVDAGVGVVHSQPILKCCESD